MDTSSRPSTPKRRALEDAGASPAKSPGAKRVDQRRLVLEAPAGQSPLNNETLTKEVHRLHIQSGVDKTFFEDMVSVIGDHAQRLDRQATMITEVTLGSASESTVHARLGRLEKMINNLDAKVENNANLALGNDASVKSGLQAL